MHTIHHLPLSEHKRAYLELNRVLKDRQIGCGDQRLAQSAFDAHG